MCVLRTCYCDDTQLGTRVPWLHCISGACYEGEETRREGCIAPLFTQYKLKIMLNVYDLLFGIFIWMFYYLFGWEMRHLHTGGSCQSAEAMFNFPFCYVTSRKNQLFCAPILYRYIIIKLYNNTTIRLLPGLCPGPRSRPPAGKDCASRK